MGGQIFGGVSVKLNAGGDVNARAAIVQTGDALTVAASETAGLA